MGAWLTVSVAALLWLAPAAVAQVSFSGPTNFAAGDGPLSVAVGDFDGDSDPDLAGANAGSDNVSVLLGGTGGSFGAATNFAAGDLPISVAVGDFDGDSDPDLAVANAGSDNVSVLLNTSHRPPSAVDDAYTHYGSDKPLEVSAGSGVLANDTDADNDTLTAVLVSGPSNGTLTLNSDGSFSYQPNEDFVGQDSIKYKANDGTADSLAATVTIMVGAGCNGAAGHDHRHARRKQADRHRRGRLIAGLGGDYTILSADGNDTSLWRLWQGLDQCQLGQRLRRRRLRQQQRARRRRQRHPLRRGRGRLGAGRRRQRRALRRGGLARHLQGRHGHRHRGQRLRADQRRALDESYDDSGPAALLLGSVCV